MWLEIEIPNEVWEVLRLFETASGLSDEDREALRTNLFIIGFGKMEELISEKVGESAGVRSANRADGAVAEEE